jgi:hypothetical protein
MCRNDAAPAAAATKYKLEQFPPIDSPHEDFTHEGFT